MSSTSFPSTMNPADGDGAEAEAAAAPPASLETFSNTALLAARKPFSVPASLHTRLDTSNLNAAVTKIQLATRTNGLVLSALCDRVEQLGAAVERSEREAAERIGAVEVRVGAAVRRAEDAIDEIKRVAEQCVPRSEFERAQQHWEERLRRLEEANREILQPAASSQQQAQGSSDKRRDEYGPLGTFVSRVVGECTEKPLKDLYNTVTEEWDSAYRALSDEAFHELNEAVNDVRLARREQQLGLEEAQRRSLEVAQQMGAELASGLRETTALLHEQTRSSIDAFGFEVRREVASMLHHTRNQTQTLQRAITRLRNTLCLPPDSESITSMQSPAHTASTQFLSPQTQRQHMQVQLSPSQQKARMMMQTTTQHDDENQQEAPQNENQQQQQRQHQQQNQQSEKAADFGVETNAHKHRRRIRRRERREARLQEQHQQQGEEEEKANSEDEEESDSSSETTSSASSEPNVELAQSVFLPKEFLRSVAQTADVAAAEAANSPKSKRKMNKLLNAVKFISGARPLGGGDVAAAVAGRGAQSGGLQLSPLSHVPMMASFTSSVAGSSNQNQSNTGGISSSSSELFGAASDVDARAILQTPIFVMLRELIEQSTRGEIDALNTMRESQFTTDVNDLRQEVAKKISVDLVHKLIERSKDRSAAEKLETLGNDLREIQNTIIREGEWQAILRSKADFSIVDQVRVDCTRRCQQLESDVQRLERAVVVGFGEQLQIAPPDTFHHMEDERLAEQQEQRRLYLERGSIDETLEVIDPRDKTRNSPTHVMIGTNGEPIDDAALFQQQQTQHSSSSSQLAAGATIPVDDTPSRQQTPIAVGSGRPLVMDARSVVVNNPRQFLHSAPAARRRALDHVEMGNDLVDVNNNHTPSATTPLGGGRVASAGPRRVTNRFIIASASSRSSATPNSDVASSAASSSNHTQVQQHQHQQQNQTKPPRAALIYTGVALAATPPPPRSSAGGGGGASARPSTASASTGFTSALRVRCGLNDDEAKNWSSQ